MAAPYKNPCLCLTSSDAAWCHKVLLGPAIQYHVRSVSLAPFIYIIISRTSRAEAGHPNFLPSATVPFTKKIGRVKRGVQVSHNFLINFAWLTSRHIQAENALI